MITHGDSGNLAQNPFDLHGCDVLATNLQHVLALPIPLFDPTTGLLPESEHRTGWDEIRERFGWNVWRRQLLKGLCEGLAVLAAAGGEPTPPASVRLPLPQPVEPTTSINRNVTVPVGQS